MKTTKTTTTAFDLEGNRTVIGYADGIYFINTADGIMQYSASEMQECYELTEAQLQNMKQVLSAGRRW